MYKAEILLMEFLVKYLAYPADALGYRDSYYSLLRTIRLVMPSYPDYFELRASSFTPSVQEEDEAEIIDVDFEYV